MSSSSHGRGRAHARGSFGVGRRRFKLAPSTRKALDFAPDHLEEVDSLEEDRRAARRREELSTMVEAAVTPRC